MPKFYLVEETEQGRGNDPDQEHKKRVFVCLLVGFFFAESAKALFQTANLTPTAASHRCLWVVIGHEGLVLLSPSSFFPLLFFEKHLLQPPHKVLE